MKKKLSKTWKPSENVLKLAQSKGMPIEDWLYHLLPEFKLYWIDSGKKKDSWDMTFWNWAKREWENVDKSRMYREQVKQVPCEEDLSQPDPRKFVASYTTNTTQSSTQEKRIEQADKWLSPLLIERT